MDISSTYFHTLSVIRMGETTDQWGGTKQAYAPVTSLQDISCGYSQGSRSKNTTQTETRNVISYNPKLFCDSSLDIKPGDRITIKYATRTTGTFTSGKAYYYNSHQEVPLTELGEA